MTMRATVAAFAIAAALGACGTASDSSSLTGDGPASDSGNTSNPPPSDLNDDLNCGTDEAGWIAATGTLTNQSSGLSNYIISVNFTDNAGTIYANGTAFVNNVPAGETASWKASGLTDFRDGTCTVVEVNRYAA